MQASNTPTNQASFISKKHIIANPGFKPWLAPPAALATISSHPADQFGTRMAAAIHGQLPAARSATGVPGESDAPAAKRQSFRLKTK